MSKEKPKINQPERKSALIRAVGLPKDQEQEMLEISGIFFDKKQKLRENEVEKTPEQKEVIAFLNQKLPEFIKRYGGKPLTISEDKVHILSVLPDVYGQYSYYEQGLETQEQLRDSLLRFSTVLVHEFLHFNSFHSAWFKEENGEIFMVGTTELRRQGFRIFINPKRYKKRREDFNFDFLDEAIIEELTRRFSKEFLITRPIFKKELEKIEEEKQSLKKEDWDEVAGYFTRKDGTGELIFYAYKSQRLELNRLIGEIYEQNKDKFQSPEEIFNLFAQAVLGGRLLPIARLIEKKFGKGSFRRLDQETQSIKSTDN